MLHDLLFRIRALFRREEGEAELDHELRAHFEKQVGKHIRAGMPRPEATRRARLQFGGYEQLKEECRDARGVRLVENFAQDARYGARSLRKNPGFALIAVLTLALGVGASTAVFSVVNTILLKPLPYPHPQSIFMLWWKGPVSMAQSGDQFPWGPKDFVEFSRQSRTFHSLGAFKSDFFNLVGASEPVRLDGLRASAGFFSAIGVQPTLGRAFTLEEDQVGHEYEVILSDQLWRERFGGDPGILGSKLTLNGQGYTVIGVMPRGFSFPHAEDMPAVLTFPPKIQLWVPLAIPSAPRHGPQDLAVVGRLNPGSKAQEAEAELRVYGSQVEREIPSAKGWFNPEVTSLTSQIVGDTQRPLLLLLGAVAVVLFVACSNVASLLLTRSLGRRQEFTLRGALGAGRGRLVRQLLTESLVLAVLGGFAGILVAEAAVYAVKILGPSNIPRLAEVQLDSRVLFVALGIALACGLLFGLAPTLGMARENFADSLKEGGRWSSGNAAHPQIRNGLLVAQVALALVLVVSAGLLVRTFYRMLQSDAGFNPARVLTFQLSLPLSKYKDTNQMELAYQRALDALKALPGVQSAGLVSEVPMGGSTDGTTIRVPDHPTTNQNEQLYANYSFASPGYFSTIGTPLLRGRDFADTDKVDSPLVTIINSAMAQKYWPGQDPIGRQVGVSSVQWPTRTIIGVVADIKHSSLRDNPDPEMYVPYTQNEIKIWPSMQTMQAALRVKTNPASLTAAATRAIHSVDPDLPLSNIATLDSLVADSLAQPRFSLLLMAAFGGLALVLATVGMYGVISFSVAQRTQEIGIRMALGAARVSVFRMVLAQGARLAGLGIFIGLITALAVTRLMRSFLYGVQATDPLTFSVVSALLIGVALFACYLPARRATRVDPIVALRYE